MKRLLEIKNVSAGYVVDKKTNVVVADACLSLCGGQLVSMLGANGAGKSTLLRTIAGTQRPLQGDVLVDGKSLKSMSRKELGRDYKHLEDGNIPVYGTGGYMLSVDSYLYDGESVCIGRKGTINKPIFLKGKFWTVDTLFYTHTFRSITPRFCYYLFTTIDWLKYNEASGVPSLSKVAIENISISIPDLVTQKQICAVLDSMTDKLDIEQKSLDAYRAQKQYLLQQMFI